ncbi:MAG: hypothetical protein ACYTEG_14405 [Planctomycetota bacterium]|jgi:hypothetical protein
MTATRNELRSFGANLAVGIDALFLGSACFIYVFRRLEADLWKNAWTEAEWARLPFFLGVALLVAAPWVYRVANGKLAALLGVAAGASLLAAARAAPLLVLEGGARAPQIAYGFFSVVFGIHALLLAAAGFATRGGPHFRRLLWLQAAFAALLLPVVFCW